VLPIPPLARRLCWNGHHRDQDPTVSTRTNGKIERIHRVLLEKWAYIRDWSSEQRRAAAFTGFIHFYTHHRSHGALGWPPPSPPPGTTSPRYTASGRFDARSMGLWAVDETFTRRYSINIEQLMSKACALARRNLTREERSGSSATSRTSHVPAAQGNGMNPA
jgi:hypothetical protein